MARLAGAEWIGFDTEFVGEETYRPELCLVQISTSERLYLIDPLTCGNLVPFWEVLADPSRQVIMHAGREEHVFASVAGDAQLWQAEDADAGLAVDGFETRLAGERALVVGGEALRGDLLSIWQDLAPETRDRKSVV